MGTLHEKLEESMAEIEKLKNENRTKAESYDNLRRAYDEQLIKTQNANAEVDNLRQELSSKEDELLAANREFEELKSNLREKESAIECLTTANDRLRAELAERLEAKDQRERDDFALKLEEKNRKLEEELKWKKEKFNHLLEAHEKIREQFRAKENEWENEKNELFNELSKLQNNLDSQSRISEDLRARLQACNLALAHEENRRKVLESQLSESKTRFEDVSEEYEESKTRIERLSDQRDCEIANLREALGSRETMYKETEYRFRKLEQENQELLESLKELQEAGIRDSGNSNSSVSKLRNNLKILKAKEAQWGCRMEELATDLDRCKSELSNKDSFITELQNDLQSCHSLMFDLEMQNEENNLMLLILKSELHQSSQTFDLNLEEEREKASILSAKIEYLHTIEAEKQVEIEHLKDQVLKTETELDRANEELAQSFYEVNEIEFELQVWRSIAERLKLSLDENLQMRRRVETSLFAQMDIEFDLRQELAQKDKEINKLEQEIKKSDNETEPDNELAWLRRELEGAILAQEEADKNHEIEKQSFHQRIEHLQELVRSLELEFENSTASFLTRLTQMQAETETFHRSWDTIREALVLKEIEIQETNLINLELEDNLSSTKQKLEVQNDLISNLHSKLEKLSIEDLQLSKKLGKIVQNCDSKRVDELFDPIKENLDITSPSATKILEARSPLRALNN